MRITVRFYGSIRAAVAMADEEILIQTDGTVRDVLEALRAKHTDVFQGEVFKEDKTSLRDDLTLTVDGVIVDHEKVSETSLLAGCVISLLPVFPGGG